MTARTLFAAALATAALALPAATAGEPKGSTTSDGPTLKGRYVIENPTAAVIHYKVRWGSDGEWLSYTIKPGEEQGHSHRLDEDGRAPTPSVRWDNDGGDGKKVTYTTMAVAFGRFGSTGYNNKPPLDHSRHYQFGYEKDHKHIDLTAK